MNHSAHSGGGGRAREFAGGDSELPPCTVPGCNQDGVALCDHKDGMLACDKSICRNHAHRQGDEAFCPDHT